MARFWEPPIVRQDVGEHRHVTWLELFADLAFVVAIAVVGHELASDVSLHGLIIFAALFIPIWWAWLSDAYYNNRFDPEDHGHQLLAIVQMFGIIGVAIFASFGLVEGYVGFALSYALVRATAAVLIYRIGKYNVETRPINYFTAQTITLAIVIWVLSILVPGPWRFILMAAAIAVDVISPIVIAPRQRALPVNPGHLSQRFGFFIIIMLGEILASIVRSISHIGPAPRQLTLAGLAIALAFCIWWIYFENDYGPRVMKNLFSKAGLLMKRTLIAGYVWNYAHLPLSMGIMAVAVGLEGIISHGPDMHLAPERITLLSAGVIVSLLSIAAMHISAMQQKEESKGLEHFKMVLPFLSTIVILVLMRAAYNMTPIVFVTMLTVISFAQVFLQEYLEHRLHTDHDHSH